MRDIKVKIWDTKEKKWLTKPSVELIHKEISWGNEFYLEIKEDWFADDYDPSRYVFVQSTGLKDKNGKEIYEGDIVIHLGHSPRVVEWTPTPGHYTGYFAVGGPRALPMAQGNEANTTEVIGNIYENPELIQEKINE